MDTLKIKKLMEQALIEKCDVFSKMNEACATKLAEFIAYELEHSEWLDDEQNIIWDIALTVADKWNNTHGWTN